MTFQGEDTEAKKAAPRPALLRQATETLRRERPLTQLVAPRDVSYLFISCHLQSYSFKSLLIILIKHYIICTKNHFVQNFHVICDFISFNLNSCYMLPVQSS